MDNMDITEHEFEGHKAYEMDGVVFGRGFLEQLQDATAKSYEMFRSDITPEWLEGMKRSIADKAWVKLNKDFRASMKACIDRESRLRKLLTEL
jgi:hypothetical protein